MGKEAISSERLSPPVGPFSQAIRSGGFVFLSGQVGQDPATGQLVSGGVEAELEQIFSNLHAVLEAASKSFDDVVRVGVFLTRMEDFTAVNACYGQRFNSPYPARTTVCVNSLPLGAAIEIDLLLQA